MNHVGEADRRPVSYEGTSNGEKLHMVWKGKLQWMACASIPTAMPNLRKPSLKYTDMYCHQTKRISLVYQIPSFHQSQSIVSCCYLTWCGCKLRERRALFGTWQRPQSKRKGQTAVRTWTRAHLSSWPTNTEWISIVTRKQIQLLLLKIHTHTHSRDQQKYV